MTKRFLILSVALLFAVNSFSQQASVESSVETFQFGARPVKIPAPEGFAQIRTKFPTIMARLAATEDPAQELLTSHIAKALFPKYEANQEQDLDVYTKVAVNKAIKNMDITAEFFTQVRNAMEQQIDSLLAPNSKMLKSVEGNIGKGLSELWGTDTSVKVNEPRNLGFFDKSETTMSSLIFINFDMNGRKFSTLGTISMVRVNQRLVSVYAYKMHPKSEDVDWLRNFAKTWTAAIVAANK
jgi:hypothetical protein